MIMKSNRFCILYNKIKNTFFTKAFFTFMVIGVVNTVATSGASIIYSLLLQVNAAFIAGYVTGSVISYVLNSIFTFKERLSFVRYGKFFISNIPNFIIQNMMVLIVFNWFGYNRYIAYILAAIIGMPVTFVILKIFAFAKKKEK